MDRIGKENIQVDFYAKYDLEFQKGLVWLVYRTHDTRLVVFFEFTGNL